MTKVGKAAFALVVVGVAAVVVVGGGSAASQKATAVTIGWAYDGIGKCAAYDGPALVTAQEKIKQVNKAGKYKIRMLTCNTQGNKPAIAKACARSWSAGARTTS